VRRDHLSRWDGDEVDLEGQAPAPLRAKPLVRRTPARWEAREDVLVTTIGRWSVRVALRPNASWEWEALCLAEPRVLRCTGFADAAAAQQDAETDLAAR
jgi:hypothetical protein